MNKPRKNRYGLSREIPAEIKRAIRVSSGFGCVVCGSAFYTYEHVSPLFADALVHDPRCMTLLCYTCQGRSGRSLSKETIRKCMSKPKCLQDGYSFGAMDVGTDPPEIVIGNLVTKNVKTVISAFGEDVFKVAPPEVEGGPYRLSALFRDVKGKEVLKIVENEWQTRSDNWDVRFEGQRLKIWHRARQPALILRTEPPHRIVVERVLMRNKDVGIFAQEGQFFHVFGPNELYYLSDYTKLEDYEIGFLIDDRGIHIGLSDGTGSSTIQFQAGMGGTYTHKKEDLDAWRKLLRQEQQR